MSNEYVQLAKKSVEYYVKNKKVMQEPKGLSDNLLNSQAGVFVTLKKQGQLRGCIGSIGPTKSNVAQEIINNAVSSCSTDPRFPSVQEHELEQLEYSVDILGPIEQITDKSQLDVNRYGVIVSKGFRKGLLLPMLEGVDSVDYQISIALQKAGISEKEDYSLERFEVIRHE